MEVSSVIYSMCLYTNPYLYTFRTDSTPISNSIHYIAALTSSLSVLPCLIPHITWLVDNWRYRFRGQKFSVFSGPRSVPLCMSPISGHRRLTCPLDRMDVFTMSPPSEPSFWRWWAFLVLQIHRKSERGISGGGSLEINWVLSPRVWGHDRQKVPCPRVYKECLLPVWRVNRCDLRGRGLCVSLDRRYVLFL